MFIGWSVLDLLIRGQSRATRKNPHGQPEPLVKGRQPEPLVKGRAIIGQSETIEMMII
jgi:hypothetical protein